MSSQINESVIRDVIQEVLGRLGNENNLPHTGAVSSSASSAVTPSGSYAPPSCGCDSKKSSQGGRHGVFATADEACGVDCRVLLPSFIFPSQKPGARCKANDVLLYVCDRWPWLELFWATCKNKRSMSNYKSTLNQRRHL